MSKKFTPEETAELGRLLAKMLEPDENGIVDGWSPSGDSYNLSQAIWPWAAMELVAATDPRNPKALLARYHGAGIPEHNNRYHIPGGFGFEKDKPMVRDIHEWCSRVAKGELGVDVEVLGILGFHFWTPDEHPKDGRLVSLYVEVRLREEIALSDDLRYFSRTKILALGPEDMVQNHPHRKFLDQYLGALEAGVYVKPMSFGL